MLLSRRLVVQGGAMMLAGGAAERPLVRFGLFTDVHHADKPELRTRFYREALPRLEEGLAALRARNVEFLVCLGDLVDAAADLETERKWVRQAMGRIRETGVPSWFVLGNHCVQTLTKQQYLAEAKQKASYCSFDRGGTHFVVLDACWRKDGVSYDAGNFDWKDTDIPAAQREWLAADLAEASGPVIVLAHQRLDVSDVHGVASAPAVRDILEKSGKVRAVFQGHSHQNDYKSINSIHYCTLRAIIEGSGAENNGYSEIAVYADGTVKVEGLRAQRSYILTARPVA